MAQRVDLVRVHLRAVRMDVHDHLANARDDAAAAIGYWTTDNRYFDQPAVFNAIFLKNLLLLDSLRHDLASERDSRCVPPDVTHEMPPSRSVDPPALLDAMAVCDRRA
jgi:hypothetical protein